MIPFAHFELLRDQNFKRDPRLTEKILELPKIEGHGYISVNEIFLETAETKKLCEKISEIQKSKRNIQYKIFIYIYTHTRTV